LTIQNGVKRKDFFFCFDIRTDGRMRCVTYELTSSIMFIQPNTYILFIAVVRSIQGCCIWLNSVIEQLTRDNRKKHDSL